MPPRTSFAFASLAVLLLAAAPARAQDGQPQPEPDAATTDAPHPLDGLWELRIESQRPDPVLLTGTLSVTRGPKDLVAFASIERSWGSLAVEASVEPAAGDRVRLWITNESGTRVLVEGTARDGILIGRVHWDTSKAPAFVSAQRVPAPRRFEPDTSAEPFPLERDPSRAGIVPAALDHLILAASRCDTDALMVVKDGKLVCDRTFLRPRTACTLQSITKVIASLAIPLLIEEGKLPRDLDTPLCTWYPQWKDHPRKSRITLRHVLTHTTGLESGGTAAMQATKDYLAFALASEAVHEPGTRFAYSNQAIELLAGVIEQAAGVQVNVYLNERVFRPLGITRWAWGHDDTGRAPTYVGLDLTATDLARIGEMVARRGRLGDRQVVPVWWFDEIAKPSRVNQDVGLVWWLERDAQSETIVQTQARLDLLRDGGCAMAARLTPLVGRTFASRAVWWKAARDLVGDSGIDDLRAHVWTTSVGAEVSGRVCCVSHTGSMGQSLLVYPEHHLVVVRQRRGFPENERSLEKETRAGFHSLPGLAADLLLR